MSAFYVYLLNTYYVPGIFLGDWDTGMTKCMKIFVLTETYINREMINNGLAKSIKYLKL